MNRILATIFAVLLIVTLAISVYANWLTDGVAICTAPSDQRTPTATSVGADEAIIVWEDFRGDSTWSVFAQRVDAGGQKLWTSGGVAVRTESGSAYSLAITPGGSGSAIVAWTDSRWGVGNYVIYAQRLSGVGAPLWTTNGVVVSSLAMSSNNAMIVPDGSGGVIIGWYASGDIYAQRLNAAGLPQWTVGGELLATTSATWPTMVSSGSGAVIAWQEPNPGDGSYDIYAQRVDGAGAPQWGSSGVALCTATGDQALPAIATDGAAGAIVAWQDARSGSFDIYAQRVDLTGTPTWATDGVALSSATQLQFDPVIITDDMGGAIVAWEDTRNGNSDVYAQRVNGSGAPLWTSNGVALCTATGTQDKISMTSDGGSGAVLAWADDRGSDKDIYAQHVDASGNPLWAGDGVAICAASSDQIEVDVVTDGAGGGIITWADYRKAVETDIYANKIDSSGVLTSVRDGRSARFPSASRNYPNPFATNTTIEFEAPGAGAVRIDIFDATGRKVRELTVEGAATGVQRIAFDGRDDAGRPLASGVYFYRAGVNVGAPKNKLVIVR